MRPAKTVSCTPLSQSFLGLWPWGAHWDPKLLWSLRSSQPLDIGEGGFLVLLSYFLTQSPFPKPPMRPENQIPAGAWCGSNYPAQKEQASFSGSNKE